jgi:hypothetical protein
MKLYHVDKAHFQGIDQQRFPIRVFLSMKARAKRRSLMQILVIHNVVGYDIRRFLAILPGVHPARKLVAPVKQAPAFHVPLAAKPGLYITFTANRLCDNRLVFDYLNRFDGVLPFPPQNGVEARAKLFLVSFLTHDFEKCVVVKRIKPVLRHTKLSPLMMIIAPITIPNISCFAKRGRPALCVAIQRKTSLTLFVVSI